MPSTLTSAALLALSALAAAAPFGSRSSSNADVRTRAAGDPTNPFKFPLGNGFPAITVPSKQLTAIEIQAHGILSNEAPPATVHPDTLTALRVVALNEIFEVAYFTDLIFNVTNDVPGYTLYGGHPYDKQALLNALIAVQAQEELHALSANGPLALFNAGPIQPCEYKFPVDNLCDAIALAIKFTDLVEGTLQDVLNVFGTDGDIGLIRTVASIIGQEGEQVGFYRSFEGKIPSALPFLTTATLEFAFNAIQQNFIVPGTCPNINTIALPVFEPLNVLTNDIGPQTTSIEFSVPNDGSYSASMLSGLCVVYINQQTTPIVAPITNAQSSDSTITFTASFPYAQYEMNGLTIAAVAQGTSFASANAVALATKFGPGLIEIN